WFLIFMAIPAVIVVLVLLYRIFCKLFAVSLYGKDAVLYRSLPVSVPMLVLTKIFTGGLVFTAMGVICLVGQMFASVIFGNPGNILDMFEEWILGFQAMKIMPELIPLTAVLDFLNMTVRCFTLSALILLGVTFYCYLPRGGKGWYVQNVMLYLGTLAIVPYVLSAEIPKMMDWLQPAILQPFFHLALSLVLLAGAYKVCVSLIEKKDGGVA
ncbi:MAG: hypothetical protein IKT31_03970, partial [Firmicutes bacterium]|nr:hypothetical protein [Bacillota bacterium]